jgi:hypothetical protein
VDFDGFFQYKYTEQVEQKYAHKINWHLVETINKQYLFIGGHWCGFYKSNFF